MKNIKLILFGIFAVIGIAAPLSIIWKHETVLRHGTTYKFRTKPVDPYDAFRGKYVVLGFEDDKLDDVKETFIHYNKAVYLRLIVDNDGFAKPTEISWKPLEGANIIRIDQILPEWLFSDDYSNKKKILRITYPFNRYYLPEDIAPLAEQLYRRANTRAGGDDRKLDTYVTVKVYKGVGVLEELYLNGVPVREAVKAELEKN